MEVAINIDADQPAAQNLAPARAGAIAALQARDGADVIARETSAGLRSHDPETGGPRWRPSAFAF